MKLSTFAIALTLSVAATQSFAKDVAILQTFHCTGLSLLQYTKHHQLGFNKKFQILQFEILSDLVT